MMSEIKSITFWILVVVSLSFFLWKAIVLLILGNPYLVPAPLVLIFGLSYASIYKKRSLFNKILKTWAWVLIIYAILRTLLSSAIKLDLVGGVETYINNQINLEFYFVNFILLLIGLIFFRRIWSTRIL